MDGRARVALFDETYWTKLFITRRLKQFYADLGVDYKHETGNDICLGDIVCPTQKSFSLLISTLLDALIINNCTQEYIEQGSVIKKQHRVI